MLSREWQRYGSIEAAWVNNKLLACLCCVSLDVRPEHNIGMDRIRCGRLKFAELKPRKPKCLPSLALTTLAACHQQSHDPHICDPRFPACSSFGLTCCRPKLQTILLVHHLITVVEDKICDAGR